MNLENKSPEELAALIAEAQAQLQNRQQSKRKEVLAQIKELAASINVTVRLVDEAKRLINVRHRLPLNIVILPTRLKPGQAEV